MPHEIKPPELYRYIHVLTYTDIYIDIYICIYIYIYICIDASRRPRCASAFGTASSKSCAGCSQGRIWSAHMGPLRDGNAEKQI